MTVEMIQGTVIVHTIVYLLGSVVLHENCDGLYEYSQSYES